MSIISLNQISHDFGNKLLFDNVNLSFSIDTRAALVGRNGTGKSTLFKIIAKELEANKGNVNIAKNYKVGYFAQDNNFTSSIKLWDWLIQSNHEIINKKNELQALERKLASTFDDNLLKKLDILQTEFELMGGFTYEQDIKSLLFTFGFKIGDFERTIDDFSGGEKTRIRLIKILLNRYSFILFDEPTNHLDLLTVDWFINYLKNIHSGYLIISHDRYLLDQTVTKIYELKNERIDSYSGNYTDYEKQAYDRDTLVEKQYILQQKMIKNTIDFVQKNIVRASTSKRAKSRIKILKKIERIEINPKKNQVKMQIKSSHRSGNDIFRLQNLSIGYNTNILVKDINLNINFQDKICFIGANGCGKTTLLKILNQDISPLSGELWVGYNLSVGYYDQLHIDLDEDITVMDTIWNLVPTETFEYVMNYLAKFGFSIDNIEQKVGSLSGGEKSRLYIALLIHEKPNLLILDEPTNHLDITMIKSLEEALKKYEGTLIIVSHDRYFIEAITNDYWIFKDNSIHTSNENFDIIIEKIKPFDKEKKIKTIEQIIPRSQKRKKQNMYQMNQKLDIVNELTKKIVDIENEIFNLQNRFSNKNFYENQEDIYITNEEIANLKKKIDHYIVEKLAAENEYLEMIEDC